MAGAMLERIAAVLTWPGLLTLIGALGVVIGKVSAALSQRRKDKAETRRDTVTDRDALLDRYFKDAELQAKRLDALEKRLLEAEAEIKLMAERNGTLSLENAELRRENLNLKAEVARLQAAAGATTSQTSVVTITETTAPPGG